MLLFSSPQSTVIWGSMPNPLAPVPLMQLALPAVYGAVLFSEVEGPAISAPAVLKLSCNGEALAGSSKSAGGPTSASACSSAAPGFFVSCSAGFSLRRLSLLSSALTRDPLFLLDALGGGSEQAAEHLLLPMVSPSALCSAAAPLLGPLHAVSPLLFPS